MEELPSKNHSRNFFCDLAPGRGEGGGATAGTEDRRLGEGDLAGHVDVKQVDFPGLDSSLMDLRKGPG